MKTSPYLHLNIMEENDDADIGKVAENFTKIDEKAQEWSNFANTGTVLETAADFQIAPNSPVPEEDGAIFAVTVKMPRAFAQGDTITVNGVPYSLYQGTGPAVSDAWKAGEVVTINFDKASRHCWASGGAVQQQLLNHQEDTAAHVQGANNAPDDTFYGKKDGQFGFYKASSMEITTLPLTAAGWTPQPNQAGVYRQQVTQQDIVSQVQPNRTALDAFADLDTEELLEYQGVEKLWLENQNGAPMAFAKGAKPAVDLAVQVRVIN